MPSPSAPSLAWTGERMIPGLADAATEMFHWQRYLYFRPWYEGKKVIDAAGGEGYGAAYQAAFAQSVRAFDIDADAVAYANHFYPHATYQQADVCTVDYADADLVTSFETIEHLPDPSAFLKALSTCKGTIVVSTPNRDNHSPGNRLKDKPFNQHHTLEWTPSEFAKLIEDHFTDRPVRFLSQAARWPGTITEGLEQDAAYTIAVIGKGDLPAWPRIGLSMPTRNADIAINACVNLTKYYPGDMEIAIVANGCSQADLAKLRAFEQNTPYMVHTIVNEANRGYGVGANQGLEFLWQESWFDLFGVVNDDVYPAVDCTCQMVAAFKELKDAGKAPGVIGPVTNCINGIQLVDIGTYSDIPQMQRRAAEYHRQHHSAATETPQVRGLYMLIAPECLSQVGGFDPRFGIGNFEDDDHNLRTRLAGYTLWIADGAFLHHTGSSTFKELKIDQAANIQRNLSILLDKWQTRDFGALLEAPCRPEGMELFQPLTAKALSSGHLLTINGEEVDLVFQASPAEFAAYVMQELEQHPRKTRECILRLLQGTRAS